MDLLHITLFPVGLDPYWGTVLLGLSFMASAITAAFGLGGGIILLTAMASVMPFVALIPVHGVIQLGSNAGRAIVLRKNIVWRVTVPFLAGGLVGVFFGGLSFVRLDETMLRVGLGLFILFLIWGPKPQAYRDSFLIQFLGGVVSSFLTIFLGATGLLVGSIVKNATPDRFTMTATHAACMTMQHGLKVITFMVLGFSLAQWAWFIAAMILSGFLGTLIGARVLKLLPERAFQVGLQWIITVLALNLIYQALRSGGWV